MKLRDNLFKKARRSKKVEDCVTFKAQRNRVVDMIRTILFMRKLMTKTHQKRTGGKL
jgi:hypothetical protein